MPSCLIEGLDLAGKSTVAADVVSELGRTWEVVTFSHNALCASNPVHALAEHHRYANTERSEVGAMYVGAHALDLLLFSPPRGEVLHVQESCWLRGVALHETLASRGVSSSARIATMWQALSPLAPKFDVAVFLTASLAERRRRLEHREHADALDHLVVTDPDLFLEAESKLRALVAQHAVATATLDTSTLSVDASVRWTASMIARHLRHTHNKIRIAR